ncbi:MAG: hypothetical protein DRQ24_09525 [Candidatus Latescibacterota bacterium]|nr:MAG: hypothetical protein DRQ24_09525 [Candidatus Latescibacterota bacterium]
MGPIFTISRNFQPRFGKLMKNKKCYKHFLHIGTDKRARYQKEFLTAKFAKKSQSSQRGNYLFIKMLPIFAPVAFFAVISNH